MSKEMREKYCTGLVSDYFIRTGIPQVMRDQMENVEPQISKKQEKATKKAQKMALKKYKKKCRKKGKKPEDKIVFC